MKRYDASIMTGITDLDKKSLNDAKDKDLFLDKGIKGFNEYGDKIDVPARIVNEYGLYIANVTTTLPEDDEFQIHEDRKLGK